MQRQKRHSPSSHLTAWSSYQPAKRSRIGRLALAFGHEGEAAASSPIRRSARHIVGLRHIVLPAQEARRIAIMLGDTTNAGMTFPDVGIVQNTSSRHDGIRA